ncbi:T9SS type A sorting domain-containing protein [Nonlabens sp.]|uniref:T9SS type A sorting domain-containing protein n=1 Tax=Nonlabens sp. TaxID=1888209 RepID=UPI003F69DD25
MKNYILGVIAVLFVGTLSAQVYAEDGYIYSKGTDIYVKGDINLSTDGYIYLRGEAQLLQGDNVPNKGEGSLSVFQEGTATNFDYNYWSSPVGITSGATSGNEGFSIDLINYPKLQADYTATGFESGAAAVDLSTNYVIDADPAVILNYSERDGVTDEHALGGAASDQPLRIAGRWLYAFRNGGGYNGWGIINNPSTTVDAGFGFSMKGTTGSGPNKESGGQRYDYRGRPNNGTIQVDVDTDSFSLVGNPYPSALDLKQFLIDNNYNPSPSTSGDYLEGSEFNNEILFWEQNSTSHFLTDYEGGYGTYVPGGVAPADLDGNGQYIGADNGMYTAPTYTRFDSDGNIIAGGTITGSNPVTGARRYAPIGQGFMISRSSLYDTLGADFPTGTTGTPEFNNGQRRLFRETGSSGLSYFKSATGNSNTTSVNPTATYVRPKLRLNVIVNDLYVRQLLLAFGDDSTDNLDWGLEGKIDNNKQASDVYMTQFNGEYSIKTIPFAVHKTVPLGFTAAANNTTFKFHVGSLENFDTPHILIHDIYNNTYHDIKNASFTTTVNSGSVNDRFEIVFQDPSTLSNDNANIEEQLNVVQNNSRQLLTVFNPDGLEVSNISLYDLTGKEIFSSKEGNSNNAYSFSTGNLSTGIYLVRILTADQKEAAVKVSINN